MSMWKRHSVTIAALAASAAALPATVAADNAIPRAPIVPSVGGIAHVLKPGMLVKVPDSQPGSSLIKIKGAGIRVSQEQLSAYQALPEDLKGKLGGPKDGMVLSAEELKNLANKVASTIMCPW